MLLFCSSLVVRAPSMARGDVALVMFSASGYQTLSLEG